MFLERFWTRSFGDDLLSYVKNARFLEFGEDTTAKFGKLNGASY